jgi:hypothetical protein
MKEMNKTISPAQMKEMNKKKLAKKHVKNTIPVSNLQPTHDS